MRERYVTRQFKKDLKKIPREIVQRSNVVVDQLVTNQVSKILDIKKLAIEQMGMDLWRARIGSYRLVYSFDDKRLILHRLRHRKDVYKNLIL